MLGGIQEVVTAPLDPPPWTHSQSQSTQSYRKLSGEEPKDSPGRLHLTPEQQSVFGRLLLLVVLRLHADVLDLRRTV